MFSRIKIGEEFNKFLFDRGLLDDYRNLAVNNTNRPSTLNNVVTTLTLDLLLNLSYFSIRGFVCRPLVFVFRIIAALAALFTLNFKMAEKQIQLAGISFGRFFLTPVQLLCTVVAAFKIFVKANSPIEKQFYECLSFAHQLNIVFDKVEQIVYGEFDEADGEEPLLMGGQVNPEEMRAHAFDRENVRIIEALRYKQGDISGKVDQAVKEFRAFVESQPEGDQKTKALHALVGCSDRFEEVFPPLLGDQEIWTINGVQVTGEEIIARLWIALNEQLKGIDLESVKQGMFNALVQSFGDDGKRVCNEGKVSRLFNALRGHLAEISSYANRRDQPASIESIVAQFFQTERAQTQSREEFYTFVDQWLRENPMVNQDAFRERVETHARYLD